MKNNLLVYILSLCVCFEGLSQEYPGFIPSYQRFSGEKVAYFLKKDSSKVEGFIKALNRKKGLIEHVELKSGNKNESLILKPDQLLTVYLEPTSTSKFHQVTKNAFRIDKRGTYDLNNDLLNKGYVLCESHLTQVKKEEVYVLLQLVNPDFAGRIKVFDDPFGTEALSMSMYGMTMVGGNQKSYYIKKDSDKVYKIKYSNIDDYIGSFFGDCPKVMALLGKGAVWSELNRYVYIYNTECGK